jgi:hypothetical protein
MITIRGKVLLTRVLLVLLSSMCSLISSTLDQWKLIPHSEQAKYQIDRGAGVGSTGVGLSTTGQHDTPGSSGIQSGRDTTGTSGLSNQTSSRTDRHLGRDAAIAGGVGGAAYEAGQHHHSNTGSGLTGASHSGTASTGAGLTGTTQTGITSTAPHSSNLADRSATGNTSASQRTFNLADRTHDNSSKDQHYGREAAVAGGVGGAAYETGRHHNDASSGFASTGNTSSTLPHSSNLADRSVIGNTSTGQHASNVTDRTHNSSKDHHYGRDAAVAGGVGGAAYEADKHHAHDKDLTNSEREQKREHKHEIKDEKKGHKEHKGLFSFLRKYLLRIPLYMLTHLQIATNPRSTPRSKRMSSTAKNVNTFPTRDATLL